MTVTVVYDNSEATELCAAQHLYLKPIAKLMINVLLPECIEPVRPFSNWEVLDQLKSLICPDQFTTVRLSKSTKDFIRFEGEAETRSLVQILKAKLHGKIIKLNGLKTDLKVVATDAQGEWEHFPKEKEASVVAGAEDQDHDKSPDSIYFEGLPCKWFAPKGSSGEKPCEEILRVVFESFGKIKNVDIPMLDPYREVMTGGSFGGFNFGLQTFEAFIQYQESTDFIRAMESLRGMKLMLKGDDGKALACNIKVMFDTTQHFSEGAIQRRNQERLKLQELEEERKKEKKREEEVAERKRKDEVRKAQEKRKKARDRRRALKERDRHRQRREKVKAKAETRQELDSSEEWEERKYLLAQRRVEALRLLRVLLKKIAVWVKREKDLEPCQAHISLVLNYLGSTQCNPQEVDVMKPEAHHAPGTAVKAPEEGELNTVHLLDQEERPSYQVPKSNRKQKQKAKKRTKAQLRKSSHSPRMKQIRYSTRKEETGKVLTDGCDHSSFSDQNSLQSTMNPDQSLEKEDHRSSNESHSSKQVVINHGRKQKIYETDEFIDYLLNYYQTPDYARFCFEASPSTCQWQRDVYAKGDGFQINLRKHRCHSTSLSEAESLEGKEQDQEQHWPKVSMKDPENKSEKTDKVNYAKEFTKKLKNHCKDIASETEDHLSPTDAESYPGEKIHNPRVEDSQHTRKSPVSSSVRSVDVGLPLADFLEEISSDSECFSETLSVNEEEEERSVAVYSSSPEKRPLGTDKIMTCKQKSRPSQHTWYSECKRESEEESSKHKVRAPGERSKYALSYSWLEDECDSVRVDKNTSKPREKIAPKSMFDEGYYHESSSSDELESIARKRRRVTGGAFGQNMKYRPFHMPLMPPKRARAFYLGYFSRKRQNPWKSEYNQDVRRFKRYESSEDYMLDSGNYYVSPDDNQEHIEYGSYLGDSYTGSLYFKMF
ncbi:A-kinase anchor protein 17A isoform X1 [Peromyscus maniculatus bairdii]|uniref:A kinase anchor protein 17B n=1 Tax=Peromyscus maniculatus bairdii TaxID=230844 RepID=A0A6J0CJ72_PERMB|nr:A-kinase anchor protein 17B-like isoform X1 [Peromyscus maniculatus bairdii]XP_042124754.1 A-kinase anchor protein 17B-like isoform X1 [Peromyscus maniculatus bairdii]XP_042124755.1 A-kinase anchor protein 17B-like isoform X1 [Peromyscus maniculatus bairdii]